MTQHAELVTGCGIGAVLMTAAAGMFNFFDEHARGIAAMTGVCMLLLTWWNMYRTQKIAETKVGRRKEDGRSDK